VKKSFCAKSLIFEIVNFPRGGKGEIFAQKIVIFGLNSLAILLSGVDRVKGKLGWKLRLAARFERPVMSK